MGYLLNYKNWRALHEASIFEEEKTYSVEPVMPGNEVKPPDEWFYTPLDFKPENHADAIAARTKAIGKESIPGGLVYTGNTNIAIVNKKNEVFHAILSGVAEATDSGWEDINGAADLATKAEISSQPAGKVQLFGEHKEYTPKDGKPYKQWRVSTNGSVATRKVSTGKTTDSALSQVISYINTFNLQNWATGDFTQYDPTKIVTDNNITDLSAQSPAIVKERGYLMLVGTGAASIEGGTMGKEQEITQGEEGKTGVVDIAFTVGSADTDSAGVKVDANHPKVKEIGEKITKYLGEKGVIETMTLTSSASPEFAPEKGGPKTLADYTTKKKPTSGAAAPTSVVDLYDQNAKLAYDRGVTFKNALAAYLGGHVKANSISVAWKISTDGAGNGRNISYTIATQTTAPQTIERTTFQGAKVNVESSPLTLYVYKVNYKGSALAKTKEGGLLKKGMVPYEQLKPGMKIKILAQDMKTKGEAEVSKVEGNNVFFNKGEKKDQLLPKERYIGQVGKAKGEEAEF
jgi:hypothetical protein